MPSWRWCHVTYTGCIDLVPVRILTFGYARGLQGSVLLNRFLGEYTKINKAGGIYIDYMYRVLTTTVLHRRPHFCRHMHNVRVCKIRKLYVLLMDDDTLL